MSSYSKSLFTNDTILSNTRSLISPISLSFGSALQNANSGAASEIAFLNEYYNNILGIIRSSYSTHLANRTYESILTDFSQYNHLITQLQQMKAKTNNSSIYLLLQIAEDTLRGTYNALTLYGDNLILQLDKENLQKQIADIISNKNMEVIQTTVATNDISITQTFNLSAVFNYYIRIYGAPVPGEGFDPVKISFLIYTLEENGIDPYA